MKYEIYPLGESAITVDFGNVISTKNNRLVINLAKYIEANKFKGFIESVPAFSSLTIFYNAIDLRQNHSQITSSFNFVKGFIENALDNLPRESKTKTKIIEVPISFKREFALDLEIVAEANNLKTTDVIEIFLSKAYQIFMLGFLPGFAYMGELDERIATHRKKTPRTKVAKGSVGIAGKQTGIYPAESPGGWQIIGKTNVELFTPNEMKPTLFNLGDLVKFVKK